MIRNYRVSPFVSKVCMNKIFRSLSLALALFAVSSGFSSAYAKHILVFGDSLSAAYGMDVEKGWVHLLGEHLSTQVDPNYLVSNASISGETTRGGAARIKVTLEEFNPDVVLLELGANDGLQGYPIDLITTNLNAMIAQIKSHGSKAVLMGISIPPSYGPRYIDQFRNMFRELAEQHDLPYIDLFQEEFFLTPGYLQRDGLHPTEITQPIIRDTLVEFLSEHGLL